MSLLRSRRGWTMIELITVLMVIGLLVNLAVLKYLDLTRSGYTAKIASEFTVVRLAAYNYEADHNNSWPSDAGPGTIPPELVTYLPRGFTFNHALYTLDWDNNSPGMTPYQTAISMTTTDERLLRVLQNSLGTNAPYFFAGNKLTFVLIDEHGNY
jgi:prepilin-type N-terminal cleavage/methylation domain-containing protein